MKKLYRQVFLLCFLTSVAHTSVQAQRYGTTAGLRLGNNSNFRMIGITGEQRLFEHITLEGILQSDLSRNTTGHLMVKKHYPLLSKRFNYHIGAGLSTGIEESFEADADTREIVHTYGNRTTGADLMVGVELTVLKAVISLDYKPNFNFSGRDNFYQGQVGFSVRTVLISAREQKKNQRKRTRAKRKKDRDERQEGRIPLFGNIFQ